MSHKIFPFSPNRELSRLRAKQKQALREGAKAEELALWQQLIAEEIEAQRQRAKTAEAERKQAKKRLPKEHKPQHDAHVMAWRLEQRKERKPEKRHADVSFELHAVAGTPENLEYALAEWTRSDGHTPANSTMSALKRILRARECP
jgi:hypothetical protein